MEINLTREHEAYLAAAAKREGRTVHEVVQEALAARAEQDAELAAFRASLDEAEAAARRGEGTPITRESMRALAEDVGRRGRERFAARSST